MGPTRIRAVTHLDVDRAGVELAAEILAGLVSAKPARPKARRGTAKSPVY
jgi:hypothetical protein